MNNSSVNAAPVRVALIGFGLIGQERFKSIQALREQGKQLEVSGLYDPFLAKEKVPAGVRQYASLEEVYADKPDWLFIAVPHDEGVRMAKEALGQGFQVLIEKPLGRNLAEAKDIMQAAIRPKQLFVGFNYRFYAGVAQAVKDVRSGKFGQLISINMLIGHGCQPDITKGWKLDPVKAGGGCLIDPGIHMLDLCQVFAGRPDLKVRSGWAWDGFWKTGVEEETHVLLEADGYLINLQVSIVKWRSTFRIEINGTDGYGIITGRNRSYGSQKYVTGPRWGWQTAKSQADSEQVVLETSGNDVFDKEIDALVFQREDVAVKPCSGEEAVESMRLLDECRQAMGLKSSI